MTESLIHARGLTKRFNGRTAVDGIAVDVARGEALAFLGPNGAGKTSTMRMIGCVSPVTDGALWILGMDPEADGPSIRARLGVVPQDNALDTYLTVRDNLHIYGRCFGLSRRAVRERAEELLDFAFKRGDAEASRRAFEPRSQASPDSGPAPPERSR